MKRSAAVALLSMLIGACASTADPNWPPNEVAAEADPLPPAEAQRVRERECRKAARLNNGVAGYKMWSSHAFDCNLKGEWPD